MDDTQNRSSYKESLKATSLFGGVELFNILIRIIRSKFAAVLLGPEGMGIMGLLNSGITLVSSVTNCGLRASAVRNIAEANASGNSVRVSQVYSVLKRLVWLTGVGGMLLCAVFSRQCSIITFGNPDYSAAFLFLSVAILFMQLTSREQVVLQGLQKYRYLAKANVYGNLVGLVVTIPLYYLFGLDAIVPVLLLANILTFVFARHFVKKCRIVSERLAVPEAKSIGRNMVRMGIMISLQGILASLSAYVIQMYINHSGSINDVGLFNAGFTMINTYVGLILTAMATDYYPRLSKVAKEPEEFSAMINRQTEIAVLLLTPIVIAFIIFIKYVVIIFYSSKFLTICPMLYWAVGGMLFKGMAWSLSYSLLAKNEVRLFFWNEVITILYGFGLNVAGYHIYGLTGLGVASCITHLLYFIQLRYITFKYFKLSYLGGVLPMFICLQAFVVLTMLCKVLLAEWLGYVLGIVLLSIATLYVYRQLDRRVEIGIFVKHFIGKQ
ncbi:MAG: O-antigen translocase [Bacteroidales bacterium]